MMPDKTVKLPPSPFPEPDEEQFLEKMKRLEGKLGVLEQQVHQGIAGGEIPNTLLEEWEKFTETDPDPDEEKLTEWVENHLARFEGFTGLNRLEGQEISSLCRDILCFTQNVPHGEEGLEGFLTREESELLNYIKASIP